MLCNPVHEPMDHRGAKPSVAARSRVGNWSAVVGLCLCAAWLGACASNSGVDRQHADEAAVVNPSSLDIVVTSTIPVTTNVPRAPKTAQAPPSVAAKPATTAANQNGAARTDNESTHSPIYVAAQLQSGAPPTYPDSSRRVGEAGSVALRTQVASDGSVVAVEIVTSSGFVALDNAAVNAVSAWKFAPATRDGVAMASLITHTITFKLERANR